ncbi:hypothetical protein DMUE_1912 [Dictyocoela muelleri]|nr:hypothetical protein DMUE_1912 [Dictyocoela muelleri]
MWPEPPYNFEIPKIPKSYKLFNIKFNVKEGFPYLSDYNEKPFNINNLKRQVKSSLMIYISILEKIRNKEDVHGQLEILKNLHLKINDDINCAKEYEAEQQIRELINERNELNKDIYDELMVLTNRKKIFDNN